METIIRMGPKLIELILPILFPKEEPEAPDADAMPSGQGEITWSKAPTDSASPGEFCQLCAHAALCTFCTGMGQAAVPLVLTGVSRIMHSEGVAVRKLAVAGGAHKNLCLILSASN